MGCAGGRRTAAGLAFTVVLTAALPAMTRCLALEVAPIQVNPIAAGFVDTPLSASLLGDRIGELREQLRITLPIGRVVGSAGTTCPGLTPGDVSTAPGPPGQLVRGRASAGPYPMEQGDQQEDDARQENRAAGQHDTQEGQHRASKQEQGPPAGPRGAGEPQHRSGAVRSIRAGARERCTDVSEHPGSLLRVGSH